MGQVTIEKSWEALLKDEFEKEYFIKLAGYVRNEYLTKTVYPPPSKVFNAFNLCPFANVKAVIIGQDPYHGIGQAMGLCFSVQKGIKLPPSLINIFKEIKNDLKITPFSSGDLSRWARQGVFMLNSVLTVISGSPASHAGLGWEKFTDRVVEVLSEKKKNIVYMLWGKYAQNKGTMIDKKSNLVLSSGHPSPFSSHLFFGQNHFSKCNLFLEEKGIGKIDWR